MKKRNIPQSLKDKKAQWDNRETYQKQTQQS